MYQAFDPRLLKADFLISQMPERDWLWGEGGFWVGRDKESGQHRHVYLYGQAETRRTVVYWAEHDASRFQLQRLCWGLGGGHPVKTVDGWLGLETSPRRIPAAPIGRE